MSKALAVGLTADFSPRPLPHDNASSQAPLSRERNGPLSYLAWLLAMGVFLVSLGALHKLALQSLAWLGLYAVTAILIASSLDRCVRASLDNGWVWLPPLMALASVYWSIAPQATLVLATVYLYTTLIGVLLGLRLSPRQIFTALLVACGLAVAVSLVVNALLPVWAEAIDKSGVEVGVFLSKNVFARGLFLLALAVLVVGYRAERYVSSTLLALALAVPVWQAESATSLLMYGLIMTYPLAYLLLVGTSRKLKWLMLMIGGGAAIVFAFVPLALDLPMVAGVLDMLGKDQTLTGRTELWQTGLSVSSGSPMLGVGFEAFWNADGLDARDRLQSLHGELITGFHNLYLETMVGNGLLGLSLVLVFLMLTFWVFARWFHREHTAESLGALYLLGLLLVMGIVEIVGFRGNSIFHLLLVALVVSVRVGSEGTDDEINADQGP